MIAPAEVLNAVVVAVLVRTCRVCSGEDSDGDITRMQGMQISRCLLVYLGNQQLVAPSCHDMSAIENILSVSSSFMDCQRNPVLEFLQNLLEYENFLNFMEIILLEVFQSAGATENGLIGPTRISETSPLGIFVRSLRARWLCADFDEQCAIFNIFESEFRKYSDSADSYPKSIEAHKASSMVDHVENACQNRDIALAEKYIHDIFDSSLNDPLTLSFKKDFSALNTFVDKFQQSLVAGAPLKSNQIAMITLAIMWFRVGNTDKAYIAIEEALKTAHHCGDHTSVIRCLFVLLHIFQQEENSLDCEEIIQRCLLRSAALNMHEAVAEAALLLATYKLKNVNVGDDSIERDTARVSTTTTRPDLLSWNLRDTLNLLYYTIHGESSCTTKFGMKKETVVVEDTMASSSAVMNAAAAAQAKLWPASEELAKTSSSYAEFYLRATCVQCEIWCKCGVYQMGSIAAARALSLYQNKATPESVVTLLRKKLFCDLHQLKSASASKDECWHVLIRLLKKYKTLRLHYEASASKYVDHVLSSCVNTISFFCAALSGEWPRAFRFSDKLVISSKVAASWGGSLPVLDVLDAQRFRLFHVIASNRSKEMNDTALISEDIKRSLMDQSLAYLVDEAILALLFET